MELFRLFGSILIDDKEAIETLKKADQKGKETSESMGKKFMGLGKNVGKGLLAVGTGTVAAIGALTGMATKTAETTDRIDKMSQKIGLSREGFQEWDFIMSQSGMSVDQLQMGFKTMVNAMDQAIDGTGKGAENFEKLGLSVYDSTGNLKSQEEMFNETVVALQGMEEGAEKAKIANDLFGRSGAEMMPLLNGAAGSVEEMKQKAHELGLVLDDETIDAGVVFTDTMDQAKRALETIVTKVGAEVMPIIQKMLEWVIAHMPQIQAVFSAVFGAIKWAVQTVIDVFQTYFMPAIQSVVQWVKDNLPAIKDTAGNAFEGIKALWENTLRPVFEALMGVVQTVWDLFQLAWPVIQQYVAMAFDAMKLAWQNILKPAIDGIVEIINRLKAKFDEHMPAIQNVFQAMSETLDWAWSSIIKPAIEGIGVILKWLWDQFNAYIWPLVSNVIDWFGKIASTMTDRMQSARDAIDRAISAISGFFDRIRVAKDNVLSWFENIRSGITSKINSARDTIRRAIDAIKGFFNFKFTWPKIPMPSFGITPSGWKIGDLLKGSIPKLAINWNAEGGIFDEPTIFNTSKGLQGVGEAGPEAIMPLNSKTYGGMAEGIVEAIGKMTVNSESKDSRPIIMQVDGKTFAEVMGDYTDSVDGARVRLASRGLA